MEKLSEAIYGMKKLIKPILFVAIGFALFIAIQEVLLPAASDDDYRIVQGVEMLEDNSIDVLCLGSSHMAYGLSPMKIYEDTHSVWYNLGSPVQSIGCSYYMAKKVFQSQSPRAVVMDVSNMFSPDRNNGGWRFLMDGSALDLVKVEMAMDYGSKSFGDGALSVFLPIIKYHTRWSELGKSDFNLWEKKENHYAGGMYIISYVGPAILNADNMNGTAEEMMLRNEGFISYYSAGEYVEKVITQPLYSPSIPTENMEYVQKLLQLCEENGAELVLVAIPSLTYPQFNPSAWTKVHSDIIRQMAEELQVPFYDLLYDYNNVVDFSTDSCDGGNHLNIRGAEKVSAALETILPDVFLFENQGNDIYDTQIPIYQKARTVAMLETEMDFETYIEMLNAHLSQWTIYIAAYDDYTQGMAEEDYVFLSQKLGLQMIDDGGYTDSYLAVINRGEVVYEAVGNRRINHSMTVNEHSVSLTSSGWFNTRAVSIKIDSREYALGGRGLNFVVYDNESGLVIDRVSFDTLQMSKPAYRTSSASDALFRAYESAVCFG